MSWHTSGILIQQDLTRDAAGLLKRLGFVGLEPQDRIGLEEATRLSLDAVAINVKPVNGWTAIFNSPDFFGSGYLPDEDNADAVWVETVERELVQLSARGKVFGFIMEGSTGTYAITLHERGKRRRAFLHLHRRVVIDEGSPLSGESPAFSRRGMGELETAILKLADVVCLPFFDLESTEFQVYTYDQCPS